MTTVAAANEISWTDFLTRIIDDGIEAAEKDYGRDKGPYTESMLDGSKAGFKACRDKTPYELKTVLNEARARTQEHLKKVMQTLNEDEEALRTYWHNRCFELEVEWVCNCVSALLMQLGEPVIVPPTVRAVIRVAEIVGVAQQ